MEPYKITADCSKPLPALACNFLSKPTTALTHSQSLGPFHLSSPSPKSSAIEKASPQKPTQNITATTATYPDQESATRYRGRCPEHLLVFSPHPTTSQNHLQQQQQHYQQLREESSTSRGRTRRRIDEYVNPPRDPTTVQDSSSSPEEALYPDGRGNYLPRSVLTGQVPFPTPGSHLRRMAHEDHNPPSAQARALAAARREEEERAESERQRRYRQQAADMERGHRLEQQRSPEQTLQRTSSLAAYQQQQQQQQQSEPSRHRHRSSKKTRSKKDGRSKSSRCVIM